MKLLFTSENRFLVSHAKNIVEADGIRTMLKNEYASGAMGELSPFDAWMELWVVDDGDYETAKAVLDSALASTPQPAWICTHCGEENDASFELCWSCNTARASEA